MRLRRLTMEQNLILNFLYELRNTAMTPPDPRLSCSGIARAFGMQSGTVTNHLDMLKEKGFVLPFRVGTKEFYKLTLAGIHELEKSVTTVVEGEVSTSKIGIKGIRRKIVG